MTTRSSTKTPRGPRSPFRPKAHGTRAMYVHGCRCDACKEANRTYARARYRKLCRGERNPFISAERTRKHLLKLQRAGVGLNLVADLTGCSRTVLLDIRKGRKGRCRADTERRVLGVGKDAKDLTDALLVPAGPTWALLDDLLTRGFTKTELARRLGSKAKVPSLQLRRDYITNLNRMKVEKLHARCMAELDVPQDPDPELPDIDWRPEWLKRPK